jgi:hypothetical protein
VSGCSGSAVAKHTMLVFVGDKSFAISKTTAQLVARANRIRGLAVPVKGHDIRAASTLVLLGAGHMENTHFALSDGVRLNKAALQSVDLWVHPNGSAHSANGPLGCPRCADERRKIGDPR